MVELIKGVKLGRLVVVVGVVSDGGGGGGIGE